MTEKNRTDQVDPKELESAAIEVLRQVLGAFGFREDGDDEEGDYEIAAFNGGKSLVLDIDAVDVRSIMIGKEGKTLRAINTLTIAALGRRLNHRPFGKMVQVSIRGYGPPRR